jgi:hypothetical protein
MAGPTIQEILRMGGAGAPLPGSAFGAEAMPSMSPVEIYQGIYGEPMQQLTSRSVRTVPVPVSISTGAGAGLGTGMRGSADVYYQSPKTFVPNAIPGPTPVAKSQDRLPALPVGLPLKSDVPGYASARGQLGAGGFGSGALTAVPPAAPKAPAVITLASEPMSDVSGQNTANSFGKPVRGPSGKVYYPSDVPMSGVRPPMKPVGTPPPVPGGQRQGGGLFSLFGGRSGQGGGVLASLLGGAQQGGPGSGSPGWSNPNITYNDRRYTPGEATTLGGSDMAFMPTSVQSSSRWQTGY